MGKGAGEGGGGGLPGRRASLLLGDPFRLPRPTSGTGCRPHPSPIPHCLSPLCDIPSGCCSFTGPWTVTRSSLRMLRRVAAFCRPLRPVLLLVPFPRSRSPVVGVLGLC